MTDLATALAANDKLSSYGGRDVLRTSIAIRNAGDGLSQAMAIQPVELEIGQRVFVVLECEVAHHDYGPIKDTNCLELKQVLRAEGATLVDESLVRGHLDDMADRIRLAREREQGVQRLELDEADEAEVMVRQHNAGVHADERRDACPLCREEIDAEEAEALADAEAEGSSVTPIGDGKPKGRTRKSARGGE